MHDLEHLTAGRRRVGAIAMGVLLVLSMVLAACGGGDDDGGGGGSSEGPDDNVPVQTGGKIVYGIPGETDGFIPQSNRWGPGAWTVARAVYDPLAVNDPDGIAHPYLVDRIEPANDFKEWHIWMRDEPITWHNGEPLTAEDVATNIKQQQLSLLTGNAFDPVDSVIVQTENPDADWDIQINLNERWATFPSLLTGQAGYVAYPPTITDPEANPDPVGTGPFVFQEWIPDDHLTVTRSDSYWRSDDQGNQLPYLNEIEFTPIPDPSTRVSSLESGDIDMLLTNVFNDVASLEDSPPEGVQVVEDTSEGDEVLLMFNTTGDGPGGDVEVRRALQLAIDRQQIVDTLYDGRFPLADAPYQPDSVWYSDPGWPDPDPDEARAIVEQWEAENGQDLTLELTLIQNQDFLELIQVIQQMAEDVGITINVNGTDESGFALAVVEGNFDALLIPFFNRADIDAEYHFIDPFRIGAEGEAQGVVLNLARYSSEVTREALPAARQTDDVDTRAAEYAKVWKDWAENVPYLFMFEMRLLIAADDSIHNLDTFTFPDGEPAQPIDWGAVFFTDVWLEQ